MYKLFFVGCAQQRLPGEGQLSVWWQTGGGEAYVSVVGCVNNKE